MGDIPPLPDPIEDCGYQVSGARVGYARQLDGTGDGLIYVASDTDYFAFGTFLDEGKLTIEGRELWVYTILAGVSSRSNWCEPMMAY